MKPRKRGSNERFANERHPLIEPGFPSLTLSPTPATLIGTVQVIPRAGRPALSHALPIRRTERPASQHRRQADQWRWSSLCHRANPNSGHPMPLTEWPVPRPRKWNKLVGSPQTEQNLRRSGKRSNEGNHSETTIGSNARQQSSTWNPTARKTEEGSDTEDVIERVGSLFLSLERLWFLVQHTS